jgi:quinol-cytochrome oxidoreductase complex cytochrome b subunit
MATTTTGLVEQYLNEARRIEEIRRQRKKFRAVEAFPFWPHEAVRSTIIVLAFSAATMYISALMPYFLESPANPAGQPEVILPDWYLLWSYGLLKPGLANAFMFNGSPIDIPLLGPLTAKTMGILLNIIITIPLMVMPFISTGHPRRPQEAPWTAAFGVAGIVYVFNISVYSVNNVIYTNIPWWGDSLAKLPFGLTEASMMTYLAMAFWILPLPLLSYFARTLWIKETPKFAALVSVVSILILFTIIAYGANLDVVALAKNPTAYFFKALKGTNLLAWMVWWTTLLSFEIAYWSLIAWKQASVRADTYEHGLNLTYFKVR